MEIKKFNEYRNMIIVDEAFNRLMDVIDTVNKNCMLINSLYAGLELRGELQNVNSWKANDNNLSTKKTLDELNDGFRQLIVNVNEHFQFDYDRGAVKYNPQSLLQDAEKIDHDLKRTIATCSDEKLTKYFEKAQEITRDNNEKIRNELDFNRDDNLESYWNAENFEIFSKSVESISSHLSFCQKEMSNFVSESQKEKPNENIEDKELSF